MSKSEEPPHTLEVFQDVSLKKVWDKYKFSFWTSLSKPPAWINRQCFVFKV